MRRRNADRPWEYLGPLFPGGITMDIRKEIRQINCYAGQNRPAWIVIHETDNYKKGAGALKHAEAHRR